MGALSVRSDRRAEDTVLYAQDANIDGDQQADFTLPASFGDCELLSMSAFISSIATRATLGIETGFYGRIGDANSIRQDVGQAIWVSVSPTRVAAMLYPEYPLLFNQDDILYFDFAEIDTNAAPTADLEVFVRVRRIRNTYSMMRPRIPALSWWPMRR